MSDSNGSENRISKDLEGLLDRHFVEEDAITEDFELPPPVADPPMKEGGKSGSSDGDENAE